MTNNNLDNYFKNDLKNYKNTLSTVSFSAIALSSLLVITGLSGCNNTIRDEGVRDTRSTVRSTSAADDSAATPEGVNQVVEANNQFALSMYQKISSEPSAANNNVFFSPYSLSTAVAMLHNAAEGETKQQIQKTFHYPELSILNPNSAALYNRFNKANTDYKLVTTNDLWVRQDLTPKPSYQDTVQRYYGSEVKSLDFMSQPEASRQAINQSIAEQTQQMIPELLLEGSIKPITVSVLTNAVYFKGDWRDRFWASYDQPFYKLDGTTTEAKIMYQKGFFGYNEDPKVQVVELPYKGDALSMLVVLPKSKDKSAMDSLIKGLTTDQLNQWATTLEQQTVRLHLPKFKMDENYKMKPLLANLGMPRAFAKVGEFKMFGNERDQDLVVDDIYHQAVIKVDELGTEAAAATGMLAEVVSAPAKPPAEFNADHPFMFVIKDNKTGAILFLGQVNQP